MRLSAFFCLSVLLASGCSLSKKSGYATVNLALPSVADLQRAESAAATAEKTGSSTSILGSDMTASNACLMFDVVADDIPLVKGDSCDVPSGVFAGSYAPPTAAVGSSPSTSPSSTAQLNVPFGEKRTLRVYAYFRRSATEACPGGNTLADFDRARVALIGSKSDITIDKDVVSVEVTVRFPKQTIASQFNLPSSCATSVKVPSVSGGRFAASANAPVVTANGYQVTRTAGRLTPTSSVITSGKYVVNHKRRAN